MDWLIEGARIEDVDVGDRHAQPEAMKRAYQAFAVDTSPLLAALDALLVKADGMPAVRDRVGVTDLYARLVEARVDSPKLVSERRFLRTLRDWPRVEVSEGRVACGPRMRKQYYLVGMRLRVAAG